MKKRKYVVLLVLLFFLGSTNFVFAPPPTPGPIIKPPGEPAVPIDENMILVVVLTLLFGIYMLYRQHQKQKTPV